MIKIPGRLTVRTIHGRNGPFNVGRLAASIGEFVIKDPQLDQFSEGVFEGDFLLLEIRPASYFAGGRLVVEVRAKVGEMLLTEDGMLVTQHGPRFDSAEMDPLEEEAAPVPPVPPAPPAPGAGEPMAPPAPPPQGASGEVTGPQASDTHAVDQEANPDAELFGLLWPLGQSVKLDPSVDRALFRRQVSRLKELGYRFQAPTQTWQAAACRSFSNVYSQEEVMQQLREQQARTQEALAKLETANASLTQQAATDWLTGVANRRQLMRQAERELARAQRNGTHLSLLCLDLDHFKTVNDDHGHQAGDQVLKHVSSAIEANLRPTDLLARVGGEEFQILLPDADIQQAVEVAERIRLVLQDLEVRLHDRVVKITASVGCAQLERDGKDIDSLMRVGDQRLYEAKALGRDRVVTGSDVVSCK